MLPDVPETEDEDHVDDGEQPTGTADAEALALIQEVEDLVEEVSGSGFDPRRAMLPQPEKGESMKDLPKVRPSAFRRNLS